MQGIGASGAAGMRRIFRLSRPHAWVWLLLAAALFMRAVMPHGYMAETKGGVLIVDICNSDATWTIELPPKKGEGKEHEKPSPCAFAGFAAAATTPDMPTLPSVRPAPAVQPTLAAKALSARPPNTLPPSTGPPSIA